MLLALCEIAAGTARAVAPYPCYATPVAKRLDGVADDWREPVELLDKWNWRPANTGTACYGGADDLSASIALAWDANACYALITVRDDFHVDGANPATGDAVLLTFAPASQTSNQAAPVVELAITLAAGVADCQQRTARAGWQAAKLVRVGMTAALQPAPDAPYPREAGKNAPEGIMQITYEVAIPWSLLPQITVKRGKAFGLLVEVQDVDVTAVRGCLRWRGCRNAPLTATGYGNILFADPPATPVPTTPTTPA